MDGGALTWDPNGNLTTYSGQTTTHDPENRLITASQPSVTNTYTYDPLGRRVMAARNSGTGTVWGGFLWGAANWTAVPTTTYLHDGDNEIAEYDNTGALIRRFVPGAAIDEPIAMITAAGAETFFHTDRQGSVIAMADTSGNSVEGPYTYDAYGNCYVGASTTSCTTLASITEPFRYTGQRFDADTGLYYYRARYYGPGIGRFYETDPAGYKPDINWYSYVGNDPMDRVDPTGMYVCSQNGANCDAVEAALVKDRALVNDKNSNLTAADRAKLEKVVALWGAKGEKNGVTVNFGGTSAVGETSIDKNGNITVNFQSDFAHYFDKALGANGGADARAQIVAHEGQHGVDERAWGHNPGNENEERQTEHNAFSTQSIVAKGLGDSWRMPNLSSALSGPGWTDKQRQGAVDTNTNSTVDYWCSVGGACGQ